MTNEDREHPQKKIERLLMEKQDQDDGVVFNGKPCCNGCNCIEVEAYHHGDESLKRGYQCLAITSDNTPKSKS